MPAEVIKLRLQITDRHLCKKLFITAEILGNSSYLIEQLLIAFSVFEHFKKAKH